MRFLSLPIFRGAEQERRGWRVMNYILIIVSVALSAAAQLLFKWGIRRIPSSQTSQEFVRSVVVSFPIWMGLVLFAASLVFWFFALRELPISRAYVFVALGIVFVTLGGNVLLGERVSGVGIVGCFVVVGGLLLIAFQKN